MRVHETAVAVAGLAAVGCEKEAGALLAGVLDAAAAFTHGLPEMYAGSSARPEAPRCRTRRPAVRPPWRRPAWSSC
ncbi:hypothetical protein NKH77_38235 [Streptomyces sp. M19]